MKIIQRTLLASTFIFAIVTANAQVSNADTMIHKLFATLKAKDEKAFIALYPNAMQFSTMMRTMMQQMLSSEQMQQAMAMDPKSKDMNIDSLINSEVDKMSKPEVFAELQKKFASSFNEIIEKGERKGVKWNEAKLLTYKVDSAASLDEEMEVLKDAGFKAMKGVIDFNSAGTDYQMSFEKVMFLPAEKGWYGGEFPNLVKKGESLEAATSNPDVAVDSVAVVPKEKAKTKTKTPTTKTKTKTKTPARKPGV